MERNGTVPDREMRFVAVIPILWAAAGATLHDSFDGTGRPRLQLGDTVLVGKHLQSSSLDFFGGYIFSLLLDLLLISRFQVFPLPSLQLAAIAFLVLALSFLFPPCDRSMPLATVFGAYNQWATLLFLPSELPTRYSLWM